MPKDSLEEKIKFKGFKEKSQRHIKGNQFGYFGLVLSCETDEFWCLGEGSIGGATQVGMHASQLLEVAEGFPAVM